MKVGEIIFHYATGKEIKELYASEAERNAFIKIYQGVEYYTIIPYEGKGVPNYLHTGNKQYGATSKNNSKNWKRTHKIKQEVYMNTG